MGQPHWDSMWTYSPLHLKELEVQREVVYYLQYDKTDFHQSASQVQIYLPVFRVVIFFF